MCLSNRTVEFDGVSKRSINTLMREEREECVSSDISNHRKNSSSHKIENKRGDISESYFSNVWKYAKFMFA